MGAIIFITALHDFIEELYLDIVAGVYVETTEFVSNLNLGVIV